MSIAKIDIYIYLHNWNVLSFQWFKELFLDELACGGWKKKLESHLRHCFWIHPENPSILLCRTLYYFQMSSTVPWLFLSTGNVNAAAIVVEKDSWHVHVKNWIDICFSHWILWHCTCFPEKRYEKLKLRKNSGCHFTVT